VQASRSGRAKENEITDTNSFKSLPSAVDIIAQAKSTSQRKYRKKQPVFPHTIRNAQEKQ
jgi:nitrate reductase cytochrome c-type subunit